MGGVRGAGGERGKPYPAIPKMWTAAWEEFIPFLAYDVEIRRVLFSTNAIESLHARYRRAVTVRGHFPTEQAALKCLYLVTRAWTPRAPARHDGPCGGSPRSTLSPSPSPTACRPRRTSEMNAGNTVHRTDPSPIGCETSRSEGAGVMDIYPAQVPSEAWIIAAGGWSSAYARVPASVWLEGTGVALIDSNGDGAGLTIYMFQRVDGEWLPALSLGVGDSSGEVMLSGVLVSWGNDAESVDRPSRTKGTSPNGWWVELST